MTVVVNIDMSLYLDDLEVFREYGLPLINAEREKQELKPLKDEQDIVDTYLDLLNKYHHKPQG